MALTRSKELAPSWEHISFFHSAQGLGLLSANMLIRGLKYWWHDRHQAPFYRADHVVKIRLEGTGLLPKCESIAELWHFSQGAFGS